MICECEWRIVVEPCNPHMVAYAVVLVVLITGVGLRHVVTPKPLPMLNQLTFCACTSAYFITCQQAAWTPHKFDRWFEAMLEGAIAVTACVYAELIAGLARRNRLPPARLC